MIKNIIPAVASTNAVIAAVSVNEALKVLTFLGQVMNNYMMYQVLKQNNGRLAHCCAAAIVSVLVYPILPLSRYSGRGSDWAFVCLCCCCCCCCLFRCR